MVDIALLERELNDKLPGVLTVDASVDNVSSNPNFEGNQKVAYKILNADVEHLQTDTDAIYFSVHVTFNVTLGELSYRFHDIFLTGNHHLSGVIHADGVYPFEDEAYGMFEIKLQKTDNGYVLPATDGLQLQFDGGYIFEYLDAGLMTPWLEHPGSELNPDLIQGLLDGSIKTDLFFEENSVEYILAELMERITDDNDFREQLSVDYSNVVNYTCFKITQDLHINV